MTNGFLPVSAKDLAQRNIKQLDFVYVTGDAYVDHPSFAHAVISRILEHNGYTVGIIAQPDWKDDTSITILGEPRLGFLVSGFQKKKKDGCLHTGRRHGKTSGSRNGGLLQSDTTYL